MTAKAERQFKTQVCVVDSNDKYRDAVCAALSPYYLIEAFANSEDALDWLRANRPDAVIFDEDVKPLSGNTLLEGFFRIPYALTAGELGRPPVICTSMKKGSPFLLRAHELKADFLLLKPFKASQVIHAISALVNRKLEARWEKLPEEVSDALLLSADLFDSLSDMVAHDTPLPLNTIALACKAIAGVCESGKTDLLLQSLVGHNNVILAHSLRVATYLAMFGRATGAAKGTWMSMIMAGLLHDLGKIEIPFQILNKPGTITFDDRTLLKGHVACTLDMLNKTPGVPSLVQVMISQHHERIDGSGYPKGLSGEAISTHSRLLAVVDVFCALTDIRPYRVPLSREKALKEMERSAQGLDPVLLKTFRKLVTEDDTLAAPSEPHSLPAPVEAAVSP